MRKAKPLSETWAFCGEGCRAWGCAASRASKAAEWLAVLPATGSWISNLPSCGMHSCLHTSQLAWSWIFSMGALAWKPFST